MTRKPDTETSRLTISEAPLTLSWPAGQSGVVAVVDGTPQWFAAASPEAEAAAAASWPRVTAVTVVAADTSPSRVRPALAFAARLSTVRRGEFHLGGASITAADVPSPPKGWVRLPHLVTVDGPEPHDELVWELLPHDQAGDWPGDRAGRRRFVEAHLPALIRLRQAVRTRRLPNTRAARALAQALNGCDLSTYFAFQHRRLVARALRELSRQSHQPVTAPSARIPPVENLLASGKAQ